MASRPVRTEAGHTQTLDISGVDMGEDLDASSQGETFSGTVERGCHQVRGRCCLVHGKKAFQKFDPSWTGTIGPGR